MNHLAGLEHWECSQICHINLRIQSSMYTLLIKPQMNCSSYLNFAKSQPSSSYPSSGPTGSMTSNKIVEAAYAMSQFIAVEPSNMTLPDFAAQIQSFIALPPPTGSEETVFVVSFGTWDIYNLAGLDYSLSPSAIDSVLDEYFNRLDIICSHFKYNLTQTPTSEDASSNSADTLQSTSIFRVIIPKLFDPTMLPGWLSQRPLPLSPSSIAEQQKNAVYLTSRWNNILENKLGPWMSINPSPPPTASESESESQKSENKTETGIKVEKDVYYYDLDKYLVNVMMERSMELEGITDASGLGSGESVFESVYLPCVGDKEDSEEEGLEEVNGMVVCKEPDEYLFYDSWSIGRVAKKAIGNEVAGMMRNGKSLRQTWKESGKPGFA